jgi:hypothetical protein
MASRKSPMHWAEPVHDSRASTTDKVDYGTHPRFEWHVLSIQIDARKVSYCPSDPLGSRCFDVRKAELEGADDILSLPADMAAVPPGRKAAAFSLQDRKVRATGARGHAIEVPAHAPGNKMVSADHGPGRAPVPGKRPCLP